MTRMEIKKSSNFSSPNSKRWTYWGSRSLSQEEMKNRYYFSSLLKAARVQRMLRDLSQVQHEKECER